MDPYNFEEEKPPEEENPRGFDFSEDDLLPPPAEELPEPPPAGEPIGEGPLRTRDDEFSDGLVGPDSDLAGMYVQPDKGTDEVRLTIKEGLPPPEPKNYKWLFLGVFLFLVIIGIFTVLFFVHRPVINMRGQREQLPMIQWIKVQLTMSPEMRALQKMDEDVLGFVVTKPRIEVLYFHCYDYYRKFGTYPRDVEDLINEGMVDKEDATDGWGYEFRLATVDGEIEVRSPGPDGEFFDPDDVYYFKDKLHAPSEYEMLEFEDEYSGG
ncbi:hypothetical protein KQI84_09380 [bacterium]|nr:hypothetical protein [bacterium]